MKRKLTFQEPRENRNKICVCGKVCFSKKEAQFKMKSLLFNGIEPELRIYECDEAPVWHLTKTRTRTWNYKRENRY